MIDSCYAHLKQSHASEQLAVSHFALSALWRRITWRNGRSFMTDRCSSGSYDTMVGELQYLLSSRQLHP